jgi:hypothetical protein
MRKLFLAIVLFGTASAASGQNAETSRLWQALTAADVDAAYKMQLEDHPGASAEVGDVQFQRRLSAAHRTARTRAAQVTSYDGYLATLAGFSVSLGDKHIWSRPLCLPDTRDWPGIIMGRRGTDWIVADEQEAAEGPPLKGAKLLACDGIEANSLAEERLGGFKIVWPIEAQRVQRAYWLLLDDANPFLKRPQSCSFEQNGATRNVKLNWRTVRRAELNPRLAALQTAGAAGFGVRKVGQGWWVAIESLSEKATPVVEEVKAKAATLKQAPYLVLDLRGNGGGSSHYGREIANAVLGSRFVNARLGRAEGPSCDKVWRISDRNMKQLRYYKDELGPQLGKEAAAGFAKEHDIAASARTAGKAFSGPATCRGSTAPTPPHAAAKPDYTGTIYLLTDNACFSSCLLVTDEFRRLGATHIGEATDANTNYMEVREDKLPSGLSMFSTLQAVAPSQPSQIGSFAPAIPYAGSIADTAALEKWVAELARRGAR